MAKSTYAYDDKAGDLSKIIAKLEEQHRSQPKVAMWLRMEVFIVHPMPNAASNLWCTIFQLQTVDTVKAKRSEHVVKLT